MSSFVVDIKGPCDCSKVTKPPPDLETNVVLPSCKIKPDYACILSSYLNSCQSPCNYCAYKKIKKICRAVIDELWKEKEKYSVFGGGTRLPINNSLGPYDDTIDQQNRDKYLKGVCIPAADISKCHDPRGNAGCRVNKPSKPVRGSQGSPCNKNKNKNKGKKGDGDGKNKKDGKDKDGKDKDGKDKDGKDKDGKDKDGKGDENKDGEDNDKEKRGSKKCNANKKPKASVTDRSSQNICDILRANLENKDRFLCQHPGCKERKLCRCFDCTCCGLNKR